MSLSIMQGVTITARANISLRLNFMECFYQIPEKIAAFFILVSEKICFPM